MSGSMARPAISTAHPSAASRIRALDAKRASTSCSATPRSRPSTSCSATARRGIRYSASMDTQVLIGGGGPTGLTLAVDLGLRSVRCMLVEQKEAPQFLPKMERVNARSMEIYRRMGLADKIRDAGLPREVPMDVFIVLSLVEPPLLHLKYPSVNELKAQIRATNDGTLPLEPYQLISQYTLEPLLKSVAETLPNVSVRYGHELLSFTQTSDHV